MSNCPSNKSGKATAANVSPNSLGKTSGKADGEFRG